MKDVNCKESNPTTRKENPQEQGPRWSKDFKNFVITWNTCDLNVHLLLYCHCDALVIPCTFNLKHIPIFTRVESGESAQSINFEAAIRNLNQLICNQLTDYFVHCHINGG